MTHSGVVVGDSGDLRGRGPEASPHNPQPQCQEGVTNPGVAMPGLLFPQMTLKTCPALAFLPRLSPDLLGDCGQPFSPDLDMAICPPDLDRAELDVL